MFVVYYRSKISFLIPAKSISLEGKIEGVIMQFYENIDKTLQIILELSKLFSKKLFNLCSSK